MLLRCRRLPFHLLLLLLLWAATNTMSNAMSKPKAFQSHRRGLPLLVMLHH
jgi:hypothetical protein